MQEKRSFWRDPNWLGLIVGVLGVFAGLFGTALSVPELQRWLCGTMGISCPDYAVMDAGLNILAFDRKRYCSDQEAKRAAAIQAGTYDPPPGESLTSPVCSQIDLGFYDETDAYLTSIGSDRFPATNSERPIGETLAADETPLLLNLGFRHDALREDLSFSGMLSCQFVDLDRNSQYGVPCRIADPVISDGLVGSLLMNFAPETDDGSIWPIALRKDAPPEARQFVDRKLLLITSQSEGGRLRPGQYSVTLSFGGMPVKLQRIDLTAQFLVR